MGDKTESPAVKFQDDVGRALTAAQMAEYREVVEAEAAGADLKRLRWAANAGIFLILALTALWLFMSVRG